jgi:hypothetical protein
VGVPVACGGPATPERTPRASAPPTIARPLPLSDRPPAAWSFPTGQRLLRSAAPRRGRSRPGGSSGSTPRRGDTVARGALSETLTAASSRPASSPAPEEPDVTSPHIKCELVARPALEWIYGAFVISCLSELPRHCRRLYPISEQVIVTHR